MYTIINQCYGIRIMDSEEPIPNSEIMLFLRELSKSEDVDTSDWENDIILEWWDEQGSDCKYCIRLYDGSGSCAPRHIGFKIAEWPSWEISKIVSAIKSEKETTKMMIKWNDLVPKRVRELLKKYNLEPEIFWTTSTN